MRINENIKKYSFNVTIESESFKVANEIRELLKPYARYLTFISGSRSTHRIKRNARIDFVETKLIEANKELTTKQYYELCKKHGYGLCYRIFNKDLMFLILSERINSKMEGKPNGGWHNLLSINEDK